MRLRCRRPTGSSCFCAAPLLGGSRVAIDRRGTATPRPAEQLDGPCWRRRSIGETGRSDLRQAIGEPSFSRGLAYFERGMVRVVEFGTEEGVRRQAGSMAWFRAARRTRIRSLPSPASGQAGRFVRSRGLGKFAPARWASTASTSPPCFWPPRKCRRTALAREARRTPLRRSGRCTPMARSLARQDRRRIGGPAARPSRAGPGPSVLRLPPGAASRHVHHALQGVPEEGRRDRHQFPEVQRALHVGPEEPDRAGRRACRQAGLLRRRQLRSELRLAGRRGAHRPRPRDRRDGPRTRSRDPGHRAFLGAAAGRRIRLEGRRGRRPAPRGARRLWFPSDAPAVPDSVLRRCRDRRDRHRRDGAAPPDGVLVRRRAAGAEPGGGRGRRRNCPGSASTRPCPGFTASRSAPACGPCRS